MSVPGTTDPQLLDLLKELVTVQKQLLEQQQLQQRKSEEDGLVTAMTTTLAAAEKREDAEEARAQGGVLDAVGKLDAVANWLTAQGDVAQRLREAIGNGLATELQNQAKTAQDQVRKTQDAARQAAAQKRKDAEASRQRGELPEARKLETEADWFGAAASPAEDLALAGLVTVTGFTIGDMGTGRCRLYLKPEMNEFVEFADRDVMGTRQIDATQFPPLGGIIMWLRRGAQVKYTRVTSQQVQVDLLSGAIAQAYQTAPGFAPGLNGAGNRAAGANGNGGDVVYFYSGPGSGGGNTQTSGCPPPN